MPNSCLFRHICGSSSVCSAFIKWTEWTLTVAVPWRQHRKHCRGYYCCYLRRGRRLSGRVYPFICFVTWITQSYEPIFRNLNLWMGWIFIVFEEELIRFWWRSGVFCWFCITVCVRFLCANMMWCILLCAVFVCVYCMTEAQVRFLKAKLRVMQEELDRLSTELSAKVCRFTHFFAWIM